MTCISTLAVTSVSHSFSLPPVTMEEPSLQKIAISGPTLASLIQRVSSSPGDVDGLLFGHVTEITPSTLSDDATSSSSSAAAAATTAFSSSSNIVATVTSFLCSSSTFTFYDSLGRLHHHYLLHLNRNDHHLLGWFAARRKTALRPSMREFAVTNSLSSSKSQLSFPIANSPVNFVFTPSVFVLFATPLHDQLIHTHEYRAYQFFGSTQRFEPKSIDIVNIGPAFRGHYGNFSPNNAAMPWLNCAMTRRRLSMDSDAMNEDRNEEEEQKVLDGYAEGFGIRNLGRLMGSEVANYTGQLEDLYDKMLTKIESLARLVEASETQIHEQEDHNRMLRSKVARLTGTE